MVMNRHVLLPVTAPAVVIGLILVGVCLLGIWSISRLEADRAQILSKNVRSLQSAEELEIRTRRLRFHTLLYAMDRTAGRRRVIEDDQRQFELALAEARQFANLPEEQRLLD